MLPEGIQNGWKNSVRNTPAINSAQKMVLTVSQMPPSLRASLLAMAVPSCESRAFMGRAGSESQAVVPVPAGSGSASMTTKACAQG